MYITVLQCLCILYWDSYYFFVNLIYLFWTHITARPHLSSSDNTNYESVLDMNEEDWELSDPCDDLNVIPAADTGIRIHEDRFSN